MCCLNQRFLSSFSIQLLNPTSRVSTFSPICITDYNKIHPAAHSRRPRQHTIPERFCIARAWASHPLLDYLLLPRQRASVALVPRPRPATAGSRPLTWRGVPARPKSITAAAPDSTLCSGNRHTSHPVSVLFPSAKSPSKKEKWIKKRKSRLINLSPNPQIRPK